MALDVRTLLFAVMAVTFCTAGALVFFRFTRKTYPGFGWWTVSNALVGLGYLMLALRGFIHEGASIIVGNVAFSVALVIRLQGVRVFLGRADRGWGWYIVPVLVLAAIVFFYYFVPMTVLRTMAASLGIALPCLAIGVGFLRHHPTEGRALYTITGGILAFWALALLLRAFLLLREPSFQLLSPGPLQSYYFLMAMMLEVVVSLLFIMLNSQRMEQELAAINREKEELITDLRKAIADIKQLSGLLPICAHCKKIRDDQGYWRQIESYIRDHSEAEFSHGICPDCVKLLYPELSEGHGKP